MAEKKEEVVWFSCRASKNCEGKQAIKLRSFGVPGQDCIVNYRCLTCKKPFNVRY